MRRLPFRATLPVLLLVLAQCRDVSSPAPVASDPDIRRPAKAVVPYGNKAPFLIWPVAGATAYTSTDKLTALFDHWNYNFIEAVRLGQPPVYNYPGPRGQEKVYLVGGVLADRLDLNEPTATCGVAPSTPTPTAILQKMGIKNPAMKCLPTGNAAYNNHPGIDIGLGFSTSVLAPISGFVQYDQKGPGLDDPDILHAVTICEGDAACTGWRVRLLHMSSYFVKSDGSRMYRPSKTATAVPCAACPAAGAYVSAGDPIGYSGDYWITAAAPLGWGGAAEHLHLEVLDPNGVPHDPYGWQYTGTPDPMGAHGNFDPLWIRPGPLVAPTGLQGSATSTQATLRWLDTPNEVGYDIFRAPSGSRAFTKVGAVGQNVVTFAEQVSPGSAFAYRVVATGAGQAASPPSNTVQVVAPVGGPVTLQPGPAAGIDLWISNIFYGPQFGRDDESLQVGGWGDLYYTLIQFDVSSAPRNPRVVELVLQPYSRGDQSTSVDMWLYDVASAWTEASGWPTQPSAILVRALPAPAIGAQYVIDVTAQYLRWQSTGVNFGIQLRPQANNNRFNVFRSSDYQANAALRPKLVIY